MERKTLGIHLELEVGQMEFWQAEENQTISQEQLIKDGWKDLGPTKIRKNRVFLKLFGKVVVGLLHDPNIGKVIDTMEVPSSPKYY